MILRKCGQTRRVAVRRLAVEATRNLKPVIGLEIHAQLQAKSKMFSNAPVASDAPSNSNVALFDLGTPGTLPTLNRKCVELALRTAALLGCEIARECRFDRKHYFYPDMPLGFQITQHELPIARGGHLDFLLRTTDDDRPFQAADKRRVRIKQVQMEMDSGKLVHGAERELIDLNRVGVGLVEIVTEPDLRDAAEATCFAEHLRLMLAHNAICQGEMHRDVDGRPGVRTEIKNINSFRDLQTSLDFELRRHVSLIKKGEPIVAETRGVIEGRTIPLRAKGKDLDYRFLPEPNLPRLRIRDEWVEEAKRALKWDAPHLVFIFEHEFPVSFAFQLIGDAKLRRFVERCMQLMSVEPKRAVRLIRQLPLHFHAVGGHFPPDSEFIIRACCDLMDFETESRITHLVFLDMIRWYAVGQRTTVGAEQKINDLGLWAIRDAETIQKVADEALAGAPPKLVEQARAKPNSKHFNKLRNLIVNAANKRIDIADAEQAVARWLKERK